MIKIGNEPEGFLLRKADVLAWLPGLTTEAWKKIRPTLTERKLPGTKRPFYAKREIQTKLIDPHI